VSGPQLSGEQVIDAIRAKTDTILLSFSCGKDSIAAWLTLRPHFRRIIPYYLYSIPDLSFVNKSLDYYEQWFGCKIYRAPHPSLARWLNNMVFQSPENCEEIYDAGIPKIDYVSQVARVAEMAGISDTWTATGVRAADSPYRLIAIRKHGGINRKEQKFYPIWDWKKERLVKCLQEAKIKLPIDYKLFGRSFDGIDYRFLKPIKDHFPEDYQKILTYFPLAHLEILRREAHETHIKG
jgi:predicted phosphoadenosine phosphosulfate sulfurtransferase